MMSEETYIRTQPVIMPSETVVWKGKPNRRAFILTKSFALMPIAIIWLAIDLSFIMLMLAVGEMLSFMIPFFALHLMPVWIWLANILTAGRRWKNTSYFITDRRMIIQSGFLAVNETSLFFKDIRNVQIRIGLLDKLFHTADISFDDGFSACIHNTNSFNRQSRGYQFEDLDNAQEVYGVVQRVIMEMQTDIEYPNAYRPTENPGFQTDYQYK